MNGIRHTRLKPLLLLSAALLLRAVSPAGYMPAAAGTGLLFEFCPEGIPAGFMQVLAATPGTIMTTMITMVQTATTIIVLSATCCCQQLR